MRWVGGGRGSDLGSVGVSMGVDGWMGNVVVHVIHVGVHVSSDILVG